MLLLLLLLFRNCCRILWKPLNCQQYIIWLFLLFLLSQQQGSDCKPTKWNHRIQRRFMWKQMDSSVDGFVDGVITGARVMKSMIGDFIPSKQSSPNVMDYLPTETTRIKYIIRNPHTKETKVIRIRPSKKVVKIMSMTPKPLLADKQKSMHMMNPEKLRKLEKEQELIAEGRMPWKNEERPTYMELKAEKEAEQQDEKLQNDNDIVSGTIQEFGDSWKPVYTFGEAPVGFSTAKPMVMSALHTSVVGEFLPEPQKQVYDPLNDSNDITEDETKKSHTYEVTEYTAEESVLQPLTHDFYNHRQQSDNSHTSRGSPQKHAAIVTENPNLAAQIEDESAAKSYISAYRSQRGSPQKHAAIVTENPNLVTQIEDESAAKSYFSAYRSQRGFLPSRGNYRSNAETTTASPSISTTSTTEEPNYPPEFMKKYRERSGSYYQSKPHQRNKPAELSIDNSWIPFNATYSSLKSRPTQFHQNAPSNTSQRTKSQKWPPDIEEESHYHTTSSHDIPHTTDTPSLQELTTQSIRNDGHSRKNVRLKAQHHTATEFKQRNVRQRGSIRFGDRIETY